MTKLDIEGTPIRVQEARRMLTNWNKLVRNETIKGVYRMRASDINEVLKDFTIKNGMVKHKTKAKGWSFNPATLEAKVGKIITPIPKYQAKKKMPKPAETPKEEKSTPTPMETEKPKRKRGRPKKVVEKGKT